MNCGKNTPTQNMMNDYLFQGYFYGRFMLLKNESNLSFQLYFKQSPKEITFIKDYLDQIQLFSWDELNSNKGNALVTIKSFLAKGGYLKEDSTNSQRILEHLKNSNGNPNLFDILNDEKSNTNYNKTDVMIDSNHQKLSNSSLNKPNLQKYNSLG